MTFTPLEISPFAGIFTFLTRATLIAWLLLLTGGLAWAWLGARNTRSRVVRVLVVLLLLVAWPGWHVLQWHQEGLAKAQQRSMEIADFKRRQAIAEGLFKQRCQTAGETILHTAKNVRGVVLMKWRPNHLNSDSQFGMDDPYGHECGEEECIKILLRSTFEEPHIKVTEIYLPKQGYEFVETEDPRDGLLYRYTAGVMAAGDFSAEERARIASSPVGVDPGPHFYDFNIRRERIARFTARYGITWDDISTREDREHWIAGGSLSIIDLKTSKVVAKRVGYMWDEALGNSTGSRSPWGFARLVGTCDAAKYLYKSIDRWAKTEDFSFKVLQPSQEGVSP